MDELPGRDMGLAWSARISLAACCCYTQRYGICSEYDEAILPRVGNWLRVRPTSLKSIVVDISTTVLDSIE